MSITAILNCYRRPYNLKEQVAAIKNQTVPPQEIWVWCNYHEDNEEFDLASELPEVDKIIWSSHNFKFHGRFAVGLLARTNFLAFFDDDTIPGSRWFETCLKTAEILINNNIKEPPILGSAGVRFVGPKYIQHQRLGWPSKNTNIEEVDLVGHAWFFPRMILNALWGETPLSLDNCEDLQLSFFSQKKFGTRTFCPPHFPEDKSTWGSIKAEELGIDDKAMSNNKAMSHQDFFKERDAVMEKALAAGWKTVLKIQ